MEGHLGTDGLVQEGEIASPEVGVVVDNVLVPRGRRDGLVDASARLSCRCGVQVKGQEAESEVDEIHRGLLSPKLKGL